MYGDILLLVNQTENNYFTENNKNCNIKFLYKNNSKINRLIRKIALKFDIVFLEKIIFSNWIKEVEDTKFIILFDTGNAPYIIKLINKLFPKKRIILWYWNSVAESVDYNNFADVNAEFWSFDPSDCKKFGFNYNTQIFLDRDLSLLDNQNNFQDVFYVGADKDRSSILLELMEIFKKEKITYNINLVKYRSNNRINKNLYKKSLSYTEVLENISNSKAIIDLVAEWQKGLTLRPLEALFYKKKLITNMKNIVDYDIYNKKNIFILGVDTIDNLTNFIRSDFDMSNYEFLSNKYSFKNWLNRFNTGEEIS